MVDLVGRDAGWERGEIKIYYAKYLLALSTGLRRRIRNIRSGGVNAVGAGVKRGSRLLEKLCSLHPCRLGRHLAGMF